MENKKFIHTTILDNSPISPKHKTLEKYHLFFIFIITGIMQMIICRLVGVHNGLEHMEFNHWWQFACEGLFYSLCHAGIYNLFKH